MNVIVFGASGTLGRHVVDQALAQGHTVTAFSRQPRKPETETPNLSLVADDVLDLRSVQAAMAGQDAVVVALGAGRKGGIRSTGTETVIAAMKHHGISRLICLSTLGAGDSRSMLTFFWKRIMFGLLLREAYADHQAQEKIVSDSGLDWTLVRPAAFTDGPVTGSYRHGFPNTEKGLTLKISRADVADFMLRQLSGTDYLRRAPGLSY
ncbi:MAG: SDR family oxidoreductase [Alphaproteobacteria bacterium]